ncbi:LOW QUALITY PROTEIN: olfactory receptor 10A2-like [Mycteria americana]|uniref:LOW QUALITY PROTEIN: olfactory receptor 10A2-like n=1 Tax=Mycteria americana TaxID=33587 RepID=UPI003F585389
MYDDPYKAVMWLLIETFLKHFRQVIKTPWAGSWEFLRYFPKDLQKNHIPLEQQLEAKGYIIGHLKGTRQSRCINSSPRASRNICSISLLENEVVSSEWFRTSIMLLQMLRKETNLDRYSKFHFAKKGIYCQFKHIMTSGTIEQLLHFAVVLSVFTVTMMGNILIFLIAAVDPVLHMPMYYSLKNLSLIEICYRLDIVPKMLVNLLSERKTSSFTACALQLNFIILFITSECFLLAIMACDHMIVAICHPLYYALIMTKKTCRQMSAVAWLSGFPVAVGLTDWLFSMPFCKSNEVNHFFCDISPVLKLVCSDTYIIKLLVFIASLLIMVLPFILITISCFYLIYTVVQMPMAESRQNVFSTCAAHLMVVTLLYSTTCLIHLYPKSRLSPNNKKLVSLSCTVITPILNLIIYNLRNSDVREALQRAFGSKMLSLWKINLDELTALLLLNPLSRPRHDVVPLMK